LAFVAGFYMCLSLYTSGVFFFTDMGRIIARVAHWISRRRREVAVDGRVVTTAKSEKVDGATAQRKTLVRRLLPRIYSSRFTVIVIAASFLCSLAAFFVPQHITVTDYKVEMSRRDSDLSELRVVFISDSHTGAAIRERQIDEIVEKANGLKPDIVLLGGDIIDEGTPEHLKAYMAKSFANFQSKYGTYFVIGNHDDYKGDRARTLAYMRGAGIRCVIDETILVDGEFYLIGRDDREPLRVPLSELEAEVTENLPVILFDHRPSVGESKGSDKVELQLSGHTHAGQIFPMHMLDPFGIFTLHYGHHTRGGTQFIVSSGVGEYAVPVRLGSPAEIVLVEISLR
jgi:predicted MPP superfamily phosphohydrolase